MKEKAERLKIAIRHLIGIGVISTQKDVSERMDANKVSISSALSGDERYLTDKFIRRFNIAFNEMFNEEWIRTGEGDMLNTDQTYTENTSIKERLLHIIDSLFGGNKNAFSRAIGISPNSLSNYIGEKESKPAYDIISVIVEKIKVNPYWLLTGKGEMKKSDNMNELEYVYLLPIAAQGGSLSDFVVSIKDNECEKVVSPIRGAEFAISVSGESMTPEYPNGSQVLIKKINDKAFINWGSTYVLDTCNGTIIKKVYPVDGNDDKVLCESINPKYPPFIVNREDIYGFYKVMLCMSIK